MRITYNGTDYDIKLTMRILKDAEEASGISITSALASELPLGFIQGILYAGLRNHNVLPADMTFEDFGDSFDNLSQISGLILEFWKAMTPSEIYNPSDSSEGTSSIKKRGRGSK